MRLCVYVKSFPRCLTLDSSIYNKKKLSVCCFVLSCVTLRAIEIPVSYTHLDVYKRQSKCRPHTHISISCVCRTTSSQRNLQLVSIKSCLLYTSRCV